MPPEEGFPLFSAPQNNKTPPAHPAKDLTLEDQRGKVRPVLLLLSWGKHPHLPPGTSPSRGRRGLPTHAMGWDEIYQYPAPGCPDPAPSSSIHARIGPSYPFGITRLPERIRQLESQGWEKTNSDHLNHPQPAPLRERYRPEPQTGHVLPLPRASGRIFPSLHRRPGVHIGHSHGNEPPARCREVPEGALPGVRGWVRLP